MPKQEVFREAGEVQTLLLDSLDFVVVAYSVGV